MAIIDPVLPSIDNVVVNYQLINYHTLQPISHSGSYASINNNQFVFLKVKSNLTNFDKRINKVFLTFRILKKVGYINSTVLMQILIFFGNIIIL